MAFGKLAEKDVVKKGGSVEEAEAARRNPPPVPDATPSRPIEEGSTTPGSGWVESAA